MRFSLAKSLIPAILTVLLGTIGAVQATKAGMEEDLSARAEVALRRAGLNWAKADFNGRDALLTGMATQANAPDDAVRIVAELHGVRSVDKATQLAPNASPYPFAARVEGETVHLLGGIPDEELRQLLREKSGASTDDLELLSGSPDKRRWLVATGFAFRQLRQLDKGEVKLDDLKFSMSGRARSRTAYDSIAIIFKAGLPEGMTRGDVEIIPPLQTPYEWQAEYDGKNLELIGYAPSLAVLDTLEKHAPEGAIVSPRIMLASGEPADFEDITSKLLGAFVHVERGEARIVDAAISFSGAPRNEEAINSLHTVLKDTGARIDLAPPRIEKYRFMAARLDGKTRLSGYVPGEDMRVRFADNGAVDVTNLRLGRGAPDRFEQAVLFGLSAVALLEPGEFGLQDNELAISGKVLDAHSSIALRQLLDTGPPEGTVLKLAQIEPLVAMPYIWAAERNGAGEHFFTGYVPTPQLQRFLHVRAKNVSEDTSEVAGGAPEGFISSTLAGLDALAGLTEGRLSYTGKDWALIGRVKSEENKSAVMDALGKEVDLATWQVNLEVKPPQLNAPSTPEVSSYLWAASKASDSPLAFRGLVPTSQLQRFISARAGEGTRNDTKVAPGAPEGFINDSLAAIAAVQSLASGEAGYNGNNWFVTGVLMDNGTRTDIIDALASASTEVSDWAIGVETPPKPMEVAKVEPEAAAPQVAAETPPRPKLYRFSGKKQPGSAISFIGVVPADATRKYLGAIAGKVPTDNIYIYEDPPEGFISAAVAGVRALRVLEEGQLLHERGQWSLSGVARNVSIRGDVKAQIAALDNAQNWKLAIGLTPPLDICREQVNDLADGNSILFSAGSARLTENSNSSIDELAVFLKACPDAIVHVEGHTDADGAENLNLALSVARAEAVVVELIARGVGAERLYAVGYGESLPIAPNTTRDGKRRNRRIGFKVLAEHQ